MLPLIALGLGGAILVAGPQLMGSLGWKDFLVLLIGLGVSLGGVLSLLEVWASRRSPQGTKAGGLV